VVVHHHRERALALGREDVDRDRAAVDRHRHVLDRHAGFRRGALAHVGQDLLDRVGRGRLLARFFRRQGLDRLAVQRLASASSTFCMCGSAFGGVAASWARRRCRRWRRRRIRSGGGLFSLSFSNSGQHGARMRSGADGCHDKRISKLSPCAYALCMLTSDNSPSFRAPDRVFFILETQIRQYAEPYAATLYALTMTSWTIKHTGTSHGPPTLFPPRSADGARRVESVGLYGDGRLLALNSYENRVYRVGREEGPAGGGQVLPSGALERRRHPRGARFHRGAGGGRGAGGAGAVLDRGAPCTSTAGFRFAVFPSRGGRAPELSDPKVLEWIGRFIGRIHAVGACQTLPSARR
jgi:hypothetical protein